MALVTVTLNRRSYRLECDDGEEQRLEELAALLREKLDQLVSQFGQVGDDRLLVMAGLLLADELLEARSSK